MFELNELIVQHYTSMKRGNTSAGIDELTRKRTKTNHDANVLSNGTNAQAGPSRQPALNDHTVGGAAQKSTPRKKPVDSRSKKTSKDRPRPSLQQHLALIEFLAELDDEPRLTEFDDFCKTEPNRALRFIDWFELYRNNKDELLAMASNLRGLVKRPA